MKATNQAHVTPFTFNHQTWSLELCYGSGVRLRSDKGNSWCMSFNELRSWTEVR